MGTAARLEHFDDFGTTLNGKLAGRYQFNPSFAARASISTGFRAPTPGQSNAYNVSTQFDLVLQDLVNNGTIPSISPVAALRGGEPLEAEKSRNYSAGLIIAKGKFSLTTDFFRVDLRDRLAVTQNFALTPEEIEGLLAEGITSAGSIANFRFFTNDFETTTQGIDVVGTFTTGNTDLHLLFNHTDTEVTAFNPDTLSEGRIQQLEEALPTTRAALALTQTLNKLRLMGRVSTYSGWYDADDAYSYEGGHVLVDAEASYRLGKRTSRWWSAGRTSSTTTRRRTRAPARASATSTASTRRSGSTARSGTGASGSTSSVRFWPSPLGGEERRPAGRPERRPGLLARDVDQGRALELGRREDGEEAAACRCPRCRCRGRRPSGCAPSGPGRGALSRDRPTARRGRRPRR